MNDLRFIDNARIVLTVSPDVYVPITQDQLSAELKKMINKQIYPDQDLILGVHIQASSSDPTNSVIVNTTCWDGGAVQRVIGRHSIDGEYEKLSVDFM